MTNNKYKLVIFDCDGTLVDSENVIAFACSHVLKEIGYTDYSTEKCLDLFHALSIKDSVQYFEKKYNHFPTVKFLELANSKLLELYRNGGVHAYDDTYDILQYLLSKNINMCVASNGAQPVVRNVLEKTDLIKYFDDDAIFTYDLIDIAKPAPDLFLHSAKHFDTNPAEALVIEDSSVGVEAANRAGMDVILIDRLNTGRVIQGKLLEKIRSMEKIKNFF